jgi:hypothetical protein
MRPENGSCSSGSKAARTFRIAVAALFLALTCAAASAVTVSGKIFDPNGDPIVGCIVSFFPQPFGSPVIATTTAGGAYSVNLNAGCYQMQADADPFGTILYPGTIFFDDQTPITVVDGQNQTGVDLHVPEGFSVGGEFTASGALPAAIVLKFFSKDGGLSTLSPFFFASPWNIAYLPAGDYLVFADDASPIRTYSGIFFNQANTQGSAAVVHVAADRDDLDFNFPLQPSVPVHVVRPGGGTGPGDRVVAYTRGGEEVPIVTTTNASGDATIAGLDFTPGYQYQIVTFGTAADPFWTAAGDSYDTYPTTWKVAAPGVNPAITIHGNTPATISGVVKEKGTSTMIAGAFARTYDPIQTFRLGANIFTAPASDASGGWTIEGVQPNNFYGIQVLPASSSYYMQGTLNIFAVGPGTTSGLVVELDKGGKIGGTVTKQTGGTPVSFAGVYFYKTDCTSLLAITSTQANGTYTSPVLTAGTYRVRAIPPNGSGAGEAWSLDEATCAAGANVVVAVGATTTANVQVPDANATGHEVSGKITDAGTGKPLAAFVELVNSATGSFYFNVADACGHYEIPGVLDGTYDFIAFLTDYQTTTISQGVVVAGSDVVKNGTVTKITGGIEGHVTSNGLPVQGANVCTQNAYCERSDSSGFYRIPGVPDGTYKVIAYVTDHLEPKFWNNKATLATADNVVVSGGHVTTGKDFALVAIADVAAGEPDDSVPGSGLLRPGAWPERLQPNATLNRAFRDIEDSDWYSFTATAGKVYRLTISGGPFTLYGAYVALFDAVTHARDTLGSSALLTAGGWTAPSSGERWIALASAFSSSYTVQLTEGSVGPGPPTISSINPTSGPAAGGTTVTVTGTNFVAGTTVKFGTASATNVVIGGGGTTITCKTPALPAGSLSDVVVTTPGSVIVGGHAPDAVATLTKGWLADFGDVPASFLYHNAIEKILRAGITSGCGGGNYCPNLPITRDAMAVFILKGKHGGTYVPPDATGTVFEDVKTTTFLAKWMEKFGQEGITTGCGTSPGAPKPNYCPTGAVTRDGMAVFLEKGKKGSSFNPSPATGTVFCDVSTTTFLAKWMEQLKTDNITQGCGSGPCARLGGTSPTYCPTGTVTRGEMAPFIVRAFGL